MHLEAMVGGYTDCGSLGRGCERWGGSVDWRCLGGPCVPIPGDERWAVATVISTFGLGGKEGLLAKEHVLVPVLSFFAQIPVGSQSVLGDSLALISQFVHSYTYSTVNIVSVHCFNFS